jgi:hypothetical protein
MRIGPGKNGSVILNLVKVIQTQEVGYLIGIDVDHAIVQASETEKSVVDECGTNLYTGLGETSL